MANFILNVEDMTCSHCVTKINNFVKDVNGVENVEFDLDSKTVKVTYNGESKQIKELVSESIMDAGYTVSNK